MPCRVLHMMGTVWHTRYVFVRVLYSQRNDVSENDDNTVTQGSE